MARKIFFSFHYENDVNRSMVVRNSWVTQGKESAGFIDKADFEEIKKKGNAAVHAWIDKQLEGTSVTVVLIGSETLSRPFIKYEICESLKRGNGIIGIHISGIKDMVKGLAPKGESHSIIGYYENKSPAYFDKIADAIYDYVKDDGYKNMGDWIEKSVKMDSK